MTKKEIDYILKTESGVILLEKESEESFFESIFSNWSSIFSIFYFLTRKKSDTLILTEKRITLIIRNRSYIERFFIEISYINYNTIKSTLEITDKNQQFSFPLNKLHISYEESKLIKKRLSEFMN